MNNLPDPRPMQTNLMLDSGAFSAWRKKERIDLDKYIRYIKDNEEHLDSYVNLDVIPGEFGKLPTQSDVLYAADAGWQNLLKMKAAGLKPIPVFHQGEPFDILYRMLDAGWDYIGISPDNSKNLSSKKRWLGHVFNEIIDEDGYPVIKTHGFAVTATDLLFEFPWASCDSMTWLLAASYGGIFVPKGRSKDEAIFNYQLPPKTWKVSSKSPTLKDASHFDNFGVERRINIERLVEKEGFTYRDVAEDFVARTIFNTRILKRTHEHTDFKPIEHPYRGFFRYEVKKKGLRDIKKMKMIFAINLATHYSKILTSEGIRERLFSFYLFQDCGEGFVEEYKKTGLLPLSKKRKKSKEKMVDPLTKTLASAVDEWGSSLFIDKSISKAEQVLADLQRAGYTISKIPESTETKEIENEKS
jgi:hypothetical protein